MIIWLKFDLLLIRNCLVYKRKTILACNTLEREMIHKTEVMLNYFTHSFPDLYYCFSDH